MDTLLHFYTTNTFIWWWKTKSQMNYGRARAKVSCDLERNRKQQQPNILCWILINSFFRSSLRLSSCKCPVLVVVVVVAVAVVSYVFFFNFQVLGNSWTKNNYVITWFIFLFRFNFHAINLFHFISYFFSFVRSFVQFRKKHWPHSMFDVIIVVWTHWLNRPDS